MSDEQAKEKAKKIYDRFNTESFKNWFSGSKIKNNDGSPELVHHSSFDEFTKFNTPAFFGSNGTSNSYDGEYYYYCVLQMKNPLEMRHFELGHDEWMKRVGEMMKDTSRYTERMKFAEKYSDGYGFFKILQNWIGESYEWPAVYKYIKETGHDGMVYRESNQGINWYFDGYLVMKPEQIKIVYLQIDKQE